METLSLPWNETANFKCYIRNRGKGIARHVFPFFNVQIQSGVMQIFVEFPAVRLFLPSPARRAAYRVLMIKPVGGNMRRDVEKKGGSSFVKVHRYHIVQRERNASLASRKVGRGAEF